MLNNVFNVCWSILVDSHNLVGFFLANWLWTFTAITIYSCMLSGLDVNFSQILMAHSPQISKLVYFKLIHTKESLQQGQLANINMLVI